MITSEDIAYIAGLIDGEGSLHMSKRGKMLTARINMVNTNEKMLIFIKDKLGGIVNGPYNKGGNYKQWVWDISAYRGALLFLKLIEPYCIEKKPHIKLMVEYFENHTSRQKATERELEIREELSRLNKNPKFLNPR